MAVTFTRKAAHELQERLHILGVKGAQTRTFHSAALAQLGYFWPRIVGGDAPRIVQSKVSLLGQIAGSMGFRLRSETLKDLAAEIRHAERAHQAALELRKEARRRIAPDLTDEQVAALDREGLQAYVEATDALARVLAAEHAERELRAWVGDAAPVVDVHRLQQGITLLSQ